MQEQPNVPHGYCHCGCGRETTIATRSDARRDSRKGEPRRFVRGHGTRKPIVWTVEDRGYDTPCWIWGRHITTDGYGQMYVDNRLVMAHRHYYEKAKGSIPRGLQLDHLCRVRACMNPDHLEPVTNAENVRRGVMAKLTWPEVHEIRRCTDAGQDQREVARLFDITQAQVSKIHRRECWREDLAA